MPPAPLTVTQLLELVNAALETLQTVTVEGEIAEYKVSQNKWVFFNLKDQHSVVSCFVPIWKVRTALEEGMLVRASGALRVRKENGRFGFTVESVHPAGEGALKRAFELLKKKLEVEGLFALERKRPLPRFPHNIALITSREAAAYTDFLKVLKGRHGGLTISFIHTAVQGETAPEQIAAAIQQANTLPRLDAVVLVRGGGSLEDLQAFNNELVVRAVATSRLPTVVGIGHERDITLAELAADQRASTPSNAAELLVRSRQELQQEIARYQERLRQAVLRAVQEQGAAIAHAATILRSHVTATRERFARTLARLQLARERLRSRLTQQQEGVGHLVRLLESLSPQQTLSRGYSITRTATGQVIKDASSTKPGDQITAQLARGTIAAIVGRRKQLDLGI